MGRPEEASAPSPLPTAPPPPYEATLTQPAYNPHLQNTSFTPDTYKPVPVIHETPQAASMPYYPAPGQTPAQPTNVHYYPAPGQQPMPMTTVTETVRVGPLLVGPQPLRTTCPNCRASIQTRTTRANKGVAHLFCLGLCLIGCCLCSCIPYCVDSLKETHHTCPKCKAHLGTYKT